MTSEICIIAAMAANRAIGYQNRLLWHLPEDLQRFKQLTWNHTIIMGRRTFESLPAGPLPHRRNVVVSRTLPASDSYTVVPSLEEALAMCRNEQRIFIIGGASIYQQALPMAHRIFLTLVDSVPEKADAFFPPLDSRWQITKKEKHIGFSFIEYSLR